jgi:hypothetical protein
MRVDVPRLVPVLYRACSSDHGLILMPAGPPQVVTILGPCRAYRLRPATGSGFVVLEHPQRSTRSCCWRVTVPRPYWPGHVRPRGGYRYAVSSQPRHWGLVPGTRILWTHTSLSISHS